VAAAMTAYRRGEYRAAIEHCDLALTKESENIWFRNAQSLFVRALALGQLGQTIEARLSFDKADAIFNSMRPISPSTPIPEPWNDFAICEILRREAEKSITLGPNTNASK
jgi:tetratricopeptide (TPR) repeat protein